MATDAALPARALYRYLYDIVQNPDDELAAFCQSTPTASCNFWRRCLAPFYGPQWGQYCFDTLTDDDAQKNAQSLEYLREAKYQLVAMTEMTAVIPKWTFQRDPSGRSSEDALAIRVHNEVTDVFYSITDIVSLRESSTSELRAAYVAKNLLFQHITW